MLIIVFNYHSNYFDDVLHGILLDIGPYDPVHHHHYPEKAMPLGYSLRGYKTEGIDFEIRSD